MSTKTCPDCKKKPASFLGSLDPALLYAVKVMKQNLHTIDHSKPALEEHRATDGFPSNRGVPGLLGQA